MLLGIGREIRFFGKYRAFSYLHCDIKSAQPRSFLSVCDNALKNWPKIHYLQHYFLFTFQLCPLQMSRPGWRRARAAYACADGAVLQLTTIPLQNTVRPTRETPRTILAVSGLCMSRACGTVLCRRSPSTPFDFHVDERKCGPRTLALARARPESERKASRTRDWPRSWFHRK